MLQPARAPVTQDEIDQILLEMTGTTSSGKPVMEVIARLALKVHELERQLNRVALGRDK